jgi:hypothetical protein
MSGDELVLVVAHPLVLESRASRVEVQRAVERERREVGREALVQPQVVPPLHRHEVAEPHVRHLVQDQVVAAVERRARDGATKQHAFVDGDRAGFSMPPQANSG